MNSDILDVIAHRVLDSNPELEERLERYARILKKIKCTTPVLGRWIDEVESVPYLLSSFALNDADFAARFPDMPELKGEARRRLLETFERHLNECRHCFKKLQFDEELAQLVDQACHEDKDSRLQLLKAEKRKWIARSRERA